MKKIFIIGVLFVMISNLFAHSAKDVTASFDNETKLLKVDFTHKVSDESKHFIFLVKVEVNKKEIISQLISKQETNDGGELIFRIPDLKLGDEVKVIAECNKSGKKSTTFKVE